MTNTLTIPRNFQADARGFIKDSLGAFWGSVFGDQDLVDSLIEVRVLSAAQLQLDALEALSLRDHSRFPTFHKEHWYPITVRLSQRNTPHALEVGQPFVYDGAGYSVSSIGGQAIGSPVAPGTVLKIGKTVEDDAVVAYPFTVGGGRRLNRVRTCICDSLVRPSHILLPEEDFSIDVDGDTCTLYVIKAHDPFTDGGYRIIDDSDDKVAVLWCCDAEFDTNNVSDFAGYPLGVATATSERAARMLSALWDVMIYGVTDKHLKGALDAIFDPPEWADAIQVYNGAVDQGISLYDIMLPKGAVRGLDIPLTIMTYLSNIADGKIGLGDGEQPDAAQFWRVVHGNTPPSELTGMLWDMHTYVGGRGGIADPMQVLGHLFLRNSIIVTVPTPLCDDPFAPVALGMLKDLVPPNVMLFIRKRESGGGFRWI